MLRTLSIAATTLCILLAGCAPAGPAPGPDVYAGMLAPGESLISPDGRVTARFVRIREDSRCPLDVLCEWPGQVRVLLEVAVVGLLQEHVLVSGTLLAGDADRLAVPGGSLILLQVEPYPSTSGSIAPGEYRIALEFRP